MTKAGSASSKLSRFLRFAFGILTIISVSYVIGTSFAFAAPNGGNNSSVEAEAVKMPGIQNLHAIGRAVITIDGAENALLARDIDENRRQRIYTQFDTAGKNLSESLQAYEILHRSPEEARIWEDFVLALKRWSNDHERFVQLARANEKSDTPETYKSMYAQALETNPASLAAVVSLLDAAINARIDWTDKASGNSDTLTFFNQEYSFGAIVLGAIIALAIAVLLIKRARRPHKRFRLGARRLRLD